jgi:hypothetical protein
VQRATEVGAPTFKANTSKFSASKSFFAISKVIGLATIAAKISSGFFPSIQNFQQIDKDLQLQQ